MLLLLSPTGPALGAAAPASAPDSARFVRSVQRFAEVVLAHGRDTYGQEKTPLFVDGLHAQTLAPAIWKGRDAQGMTEDWVMSNFASQQALMRTLDGLTGLTGDPQYRQAAEDAARYALEHLVSPSGLLYWGGHLAWDLEHEKAIGQGGPNTHELKSNQPHYTLMWRVHPAGTRRLIEAIWGGHILDWSRLDYNRHAAVQRPVPPDWAHPFDEKIAVPFPATGGNLSFVNVTPPLVHSAVSLATLGRSDEALTWARRLVQRWQEGRDPQTGLGGGQLSYRQLDRAHQALGHVHPNINEAKIVATYHQTGRYHQLPLAQLQAAEDLIAAGGDRAALGRQFIQWASDDLQVYARHSYDPGQGEFAALMTDGTRLRWQESKKGYYIPASFAPVPPDGQVLWTYAAAWRLTRDSAHWEMVRALGQRLGLGDLGAPAGGRRLHRQTSHDDWQTLYALLELHRAAPDREILALASRVGDNLLKTQAPSGLYPRPTYEYGRTGDEVALALLHLAAALAGQASALPPPRFDYAFFHCVYHGQLEPRQIKRDDARTYDHLVFYGKR